MAVSKTRFLDIGNVIKMATGKQHHSVTSTGEDGESQVVARTTLDERIYYYEWDAPAKQWTKINNQDPPAPADLRDGLFDGQLAEVRLPIQN